MAELGKKSFGKRAAQTHFDRKEKGATTAHGGEAEHGGHPERDPARPRVGRKRYSLATANTCAGKHFIQYVSHQPASRVDVARLRELLDQKLMERQARESGICPVREELFSQCFDEIIRQVTISEPERGLLLLRIRDEIKMTIAAYQTLYQSAVTFGMRKQLQAEHGKADLEKRIEDLEARKIKLENKVIELKSKMDAIDKRNKERKEVEQKKREQEIEFLKYQESHLSKFLKTLNDNK